MSYFLTFFLFLFLGLVSNLLYIFFFKNYKYLLDIPNYRSSHSSATLKGGGLIFVVLFCLYLFFSNLNFYGIYFISAILFLSFISFLDDLLDVNFKIRLVAHSFITFLSFYGFLNYIEFSNYFFLFDSNIFNYLLTFIFIIWLINVFNFMDGIDGYAVLQSIYILIFFIICIFSNSNSISLNLSVFLVLLSLLLSFLFFNFPKAKLFMGDVGSSTLGYILVILGFYLINSNVITISVYLCIFSVFLVDSSYTLIVRVLSKQNFFKAHKTHLYQKLNIYFESSFNSHLSVDVFFFLINAFIIMPYAFFLNVYNLNNFFFLIPIYLPLIFLCLVFKAGK